MILGTAYVTGYEPIHDAQKKVIGIYFVGYPKELLNPAEVGSDLFGPGARSRGRAFR